MRIDVSRPLVNFDGKPMKERDSEGKEKPILLRDLCCISLTATNPTETVSGTEKVRRFTLAQKVFANDTVDVTAEDVVLLKKLINDTYGVILVGAAWAALEASEEVPAVPANGAAATV